MTDEKTAFRLQFLHDVGAPLMVAVDGAMPGADEKAAAEQVAALLTRTVQASISLADSLKIADADDGVRAGLAALAARLLGAHFAVAGKMPGDAEVRRIAASMDAVLAFADNFMPGAEGRARLEMTDGGVLPDETQMAIQFAAAMVPVMTVVAAFPFGRPEKKLLQDIGDRLTGDAEDLRRDLAGDDMSAAAARRADLQCLRILCDIYAACHAAETTHLAAMPSEARDGLAAGGQIPMEPVWEAYGLRLAMLGALGGGTGRRSAPGSVMPSPVRPPVAAVPAAPEPAAATPVVEARKDDPLSFFAKKKSGGGEAGTGG